MDDNCRDCIRVKTLEEKVGKIDELCTDNRNRVTILEKIVAVSDERYINISKKLDELLLKFDRQSDRLPSMVWAVAGAVASGVIMWLIK